MKFILTSKGNYLNTNYIVKMYYQQSGERTEIIAETNDAYELIYFDKNEDRCIGKFHDLIKQINGTQ